MAETASKNKAIQLRFLTFWENLEINYSKFFSESLFKAFKKFSLISGLCITGVGLFSSFWYVEKSCSEQ